MRALDELAARRGDRRPRRLRGAGPAGPAALSQLPRGPRRPGVQPVYRKCLLPNYGVFDEQRYFEPGVGAGDGRASAASRVGPHGLRGLLGPGPAASLEAQAGATLIVNPSGSPYHRGKGLERSEMFADRARATAPTSPSATPSAARTSWSSTGLPALRSRRRDRSPARRSSRRSSSLCDAMPGRAQAPAPDRGEPRSPRRSTRSTRRSCLRLRDYVGKNGFEPVGSPLSGGIDSALVALLAATRSAATA